MWLFVFFDLPTNTKTERKAASKFRKGLLKDGFSMMQYSVYIRHCPTFENGDVHARRVKKMVPTKGFVSVLRVTDKQYGKIVNYIDSNKAGLQHKPLPQLELF